MPPAPVDLLPALLLPAFVLLALGVFMPFTGGRETRRREAWARFDSVARIRGLTSAERSGLARWAQLACADSPHYALVRRKDFDRFTRDEVEQVLARLQQLDPVGVGARDLAECLQLQLGQLETGVPGRDLALALAGAHLDAVAAQDYAGLRRQLGVAEEDLHQALALLRACNPRPGAAIQPVAPDYITPDVYVRKQDGRWIVEVNRSAAPAGQPGLCRHAQGQRGA